MGKKVYVILSFFLFFSLQGTITAAKQLDTATWSKMSEKYDYPPPKEVEKKEDKKERPKPETTNKAPDIPHFGAGLVNMALYFGIAVLFILLIVLLVKADVIKVGKRNVKLNPTFDAENPEELVLTELEKELNQAAVDNNYNRCLRYEYLLLLEKLQSLGLIRWHKYNTNGDYLNQLIDYKFHKRIRDLTIVYEYYWYGEHVLNLADYNKLAVTFNQLKGEMI